MAFEYKFRNSAGNLALEPDETFCRVIKTLDLGGNASGTVSIPEFDDTLGIFTIHFRYTASGQKFGPILPTLHWDNTTKILSYSKTVTVVGDSDDYTLTFIHYR